MTPDWLEETWEGWTARIAAELGALADDDWMTFAVHVPSKASGTDAAEAAKAAAPGRRRRRAASTAPRGSAVREVLLQVRRLEGMLALECVGDTEFEGLTELSGAQQQSLSQLGWELGSGRAEEPPTFSRIFDDPEGVAAEEAARLLGSSLAEVLGASDPGEVDVRRGPQKAPGRGR